MTLEWPFLSIALAVILLVVAEVVQRVVSLRRSWPIRWIWAVAILAAVLVPAWWRVPVSASRRLAVEVKSAQQIPLLPKTVAQAGVPSSLPIGDDRTKLSFLYFSPSITRWLLLGWLATSATLALAMIGSALRLRADRTRWRRTRIGGQELFVAPALGPALVGFVRPEIVLPEWAIALPADQLATIVQHEAEHRAAHDQLLLLASVVAVITMPWNLGLWMLRRRLHGAVELDCDARVLAHGVSAPAYANILLGAWSVARAESVWIPSPAFAEHRSGLGARVEHLMRPEPRRKTMKTIAGVLIVTVIAAAAPKLPTPAHPVTGQPTILAYSGITQAAQGKRAMVYIDFVKRPELNPHPMTDADRVGFPPRDSITVIQDMNPPESVKRFGKDGANGVRMFYTDRYIRTGGEILTGPGVEHDIARAAPLDAKPEDFTDRIYTRMFTGISMSAASEQSARAIILEAQRAQEALTVKTLTMKPGSRLNCEIWDQRKAITADRDARIGKLVTVPTERALFERRAEENKPRGKIPGC